jgi:hypothetical protein
MSRAWEDTIPLGLEDSGRLKADLTSRGVLVRLSPARSCYLAVS